MVLKGCVIRGFEIRTFAQFEPEFAARDERELLELLADGRIAPMSRPFMASTTSPPRSAP